MIQTRDRVKVFWLSQSQVIMIYIYWLMPYGYLLIDITCPLFTCYSLICLPFLLRRRQRARLLGMSQPNLNTCGIGEDEDELMVDNCVAEDDLSPMTSRLLKRTTSNPNMIDSPAASHQESKVSIGHES